MDTNINSINTAIKTAPFDLELEMTSAKQVETVSAVVELFQQFTDKLELGQRGLFIYQPAENQAYSVEMGVCDQNGFTKPCLRERFCLIKDKENPSDSPLQFTKDSLTRIEYLLSVSLGNLGLSLEFASISNLNPREAQSCYDELEKQLTAPGQILSYQIEGSINLENEALSQEILDKMDSIAEEKIGQLNDMLPKIDIEDAINNLSPLSTDSDMWFLPNEIRTS